MSVRWKLSALGLASGILALYEVGRATAFDVSDYPAIGLITEF